ncbi:MAG: DUF6146 family protein [Bacteroidota bacterium]
MRALLILLIAMVGFSSCKTVNNTNTVADEKLKAAIENDTVSIASEDGGYEITIIDPGFNAWLYSIARPEGYYSQEFMEQRNLLLVREWNLRVIQPLDFDPNLYLLRIDYDPKIDYGYELNYKLYNYFIYFQLKYKQQLTALVPRI